MFALLDPEQEMLAETARAIARAAAVTTPDDVGRVDEAKVWRTLADAGLLGLRRREQGRPWASGIEAMIVAHELGAALTPAPYATSGPLAVELLELAGVGDEHADEVSDGTVRVGLLLRASMREVADSSEPRAVLIGHSGFDYALALRPVDGGAQLVRVGVDGFERSAAAADLTLPLSTRPFGAPSTTDELGHPIVEHDLLRWTALALTLASADCAGAMRAALDGVVDYAKDRIAYNVPIGSFQALQHLCADAFVACEGAVTANNYAAWAVDALDAPDALLAARTAKAWNARFGRTVMEIVTQVYGGIGHTWEHSTHLYLRRALFDAVVFGDEAHQLDGIHELRRAARSGEADKGPR